KSGRRASPTGTDLLQATGVGRRGDAVEIIADPEIGAAVWVVVEQIAAGIELRAILRDDVAAVAGVDRDPVCAVGVRRTKKAVGVVDAIVVARRHALAARA